jgi:hypothetical protein
MTIQNYRHPINHLQKDEMSKLDLDCLFKLALPPTNVDDFTYLVNDPLLPNLLSESSFYFLCKRPCLLFRQLEITNHTIVGQIYQTVTEKVIDFKLPLFQKNIISGDKRDIKLGFSHNKAFNSKVTSKENLTLIGYDNIEIITVSESDEKENSFIKYITPDIILERKWNNMWNCELKGDLNHQSTFEILYIGESVKQPIWKRLNSHSKLQNILSREYPFYAGMKISSEIIILLFELKSTDDSRMLSEMKKEDIIKYITQKDNASEKSIFYDIEKALIKAFNPRYNIQKYDSYPKSKNGLYKDKYHTLTYSIADPITLVYNGKLFACGTNKTKTNYIQVNVDKKELEIKTAYNAV